MTVMCKNLAMSKVFKVLRHLSHVYLTPRDLNYYLNGTKDSCQAQKMVGLSRRSRNLLSFYYTKRFFLDGNNFLCALFAKFDHGK